MVTEDGSHPHPSWCHRDGLGAALSSLAVPPTCLYIGRQRFLTVTADSHTMPAELHQQPPRARRVLPKHGGDRTWKVRSGDDASEHRQCDAPLDEGSACATAVAADLLPGTGDPGTAKAELSL